MNNNPCSNGANMNNIRMRVKSNFFLPKKFASRMNQKDICNAYNRCKQATSLPPMKYQQSMGKFYLLDSKSPLSGREYRILLSKSSKISQLKTIAKKVELVYKKETKLTKTFLRTNIIEALKKAKIKEPILIPNKCRKEVKQNAKNNKNNLNIDPNFNLPVNNNLNGVNNIIGANLNLNKQNLMVNNQGRTVNNQGRPLNNQGRPLNNQGRPLNNQGRPMNNQGRPMNNQGRPMNNQGRPLNNQGRPVNNQGRAVNNSSKNSGFFSKLFKNKKNTNTAPPLRTQPPVERIVKQPNTPSLRKKRAYNNYSNLRSQADEVKELIE